MPQIRPVIFLTCMLVALSATGRPDLGLPDRPSGQASPELATLGKALFFDRRLSVNGTLSCAMCHVPEQGFAQNQLATPVGLEGRAVKRNSPSLLNVAWQQHLFHDGREFTLENQVWSPLLSPREMGNLSIGLVLEKVGSLDDYAERFSAMEGGLNAHNLGRALAAYQRTLIAADSPFDRWFFSDDEDAVSDDAKAGFELFRNLGCSSCHLVNSEHAMFQDDQFHNTGLGRERAMNDKPGTRVIQLTETISITTDEEFEGEVFNDLGRYEVTGRVEDRWRYRTPTLRNVALTAPYMHDGSMPDLEAVIRFYMQGGFDDEHRDARIVPFALDKEEIASMIAFLESLTSSHIEKLIDDARSTGVGDY